MVVVRLFFCNKYLSPYNTSMNLQIFVGGGLLTALLQNSKTLKLHFMLTYKQETRLVDILRLKLCKMNPKSQI